MAKGKEGDITETSEGDISKGGFAWGRGIGILFSDAGPGEVRSKRMYKRKIIVSLCRRRLRDEMTFIFTIADACT